MKIIRKLLLLVVGIFILTSCNSISTGGQALNSQSPARLKSGEALSPFTQFENFEKGGELGIENEQVDSILRSYGIYDKIMAKVPREDYTGSNYSDVKISGFSIGNKTVALLQINKGHLYIYVMLSNSGDKWIADGFAYLAERFKPEYRVEKSNDNTKYWLVVKHEANHGTGLQIFNETWYKPDGTVAGEYPVEGSTLFFPQSVQPEANTYFFSSADYDGDSRIHLSYSISFEYDYRDNPQDEGFYFTSKYRPVIREHWEYDLKTQRLQFTTCDPALPQNLVGMKRKVSSDYGILQGYIDFYRARLGDKMVTTLEEWEKFMELK